MKRILISILSVFSVLIFISAVSTLNSGVYEWQKLIPKKTGSGSVRGILKSPTRSLGMFEINAITLNTGKFIKEYKVKEGSDELLIIKDGEAVLSINGKAQDLEKGSVVVVSQGDRVMIKNSQSEVLTYYSILFQSKNTSVSSQGIKQVPPFIKEWSSLEFKPSATGGRRDVMRQPTSALKELEMHISTLNAGLPSHNAHAHPDEELIMVKSGNVEETIAGTPYLLGPGSLIFVTNDDNHGIRNAGQGPCEYYAIRWLVD